MDSASEVGNNVLPLTAQPGQEAIQQQLKKAQNDLDKLNASLLDSKTRLDELADRWQGYGDAQKQLTDWVKALEEKLGTGLELQPNLEAKREQAQQYKVRMMMMIELKDINFLH